MGTLSTFGAEKAVFSREYSSRMYGLPAYFWSRWIVELPTPILLPVVSSLIMYWFVGYQNTAEKFGWFALFIVLMTNCVAGGAALGVFVSCAFRDIGTALAVMPVFMMPLMIFSGFFVNASSLGWWFRWISYISPMKYGFVGLVKNEFEGLTITCDAGVDSGCPNGIHSGQHFIELLGFDDLGSVGQNAGILFALMWTFLLLAYFALWAGVRRR